MKQIGPTTFQRTQDAMGALIAIGIRNGMQAAQAIREKRLAPGYIPYVKTAFGSIPEVKRALQRLRVS